MRSASSLKMTAFGAAAALLAASSAFAAPVVSGWTFERDQNSERISIRWDETAPVEMNQFAQARQVVAVLPGATLEPGTRTRLAAKDSALIDQARLQEVTLPDGRQGVQLTLILSRWADPSTESRGDQFVVSFDAPAQAPSALPASSKGDGLVLNDDKVSVMNTSYGAFNAPGTGAGQSPQNDGDAIQNYFVPPPVEQPEDQQGRGLEDVAVEGKLNQMVRRVDFQGTSLENVLRLISEEAELNIMITPSDVAGKTVTLRLRNVTLRQMLETILKANDLGYTIEDGGIVRIVPRSQVKTTVRETVTETILINWVNAADVANALEPFINEEEGGVLEVSEATNTIIVRDVPETVQEIQDLVSRIDVPEKQVLIEMRLVNMTESARRAFGMRTNVESQSTEQRVFRDTTDFFNQTEFANSTTTINNSTGTNVQNSSETTQSVEDELTQILGGLFTGERTVESDSEVENTVDNTLQASRQFVSELSSVPSSRAGVGLLAPDATALQYSGLFSAGVFGSDYDVEIGLNAEENRGNAVTLANPSVLSLNNQEATVEIKRQIPYVSAVNSDEGSVATVEFVDVGTQVNILPRITNNGYVMMEIAPEQIIDTGERPGGVPVTDERRVQASVIVRDENTVALGGLREFSSTSAENGVPYLLRLPVLSWLFKNQANEQDKTELYLFVTPQIVKDLTPSDYQMALYDKIDYNWDLPDYYYDEVMPRKAPGEENNPNLKYDN